MRGMSTLIIMIVFIIIIISSVSFVAVLNLSGANPVVRNSTEPEAIESFAIVGTNNNLVMIENTGEKDISGLAFFVDSIEKAVSTDCPEGIKVGETCSFMIQDVTEGKYELKIVGRQQIEKTTMSILTVETDQ